MSQIWNFHFEVLLNYKMNIKFPIPIKVSKEFLLWVIKNSCQWTTPFVNHLKCLECFDLKPQKKTIPREYKWTTFVIYVWNFGWLGIKSKWAHSSLWELNHMKYLGCFDLKDQESTIFQAYKWIASIICVLKIGSIRSITQVGYTTHN
jgi:hypothetical protein